MNFLRHHPFNGVYYAIYSSVHGHDLCYAMSKYPDRDLTYQGVLHSNGNIGITNNPTYYYANNHGSLVQIKDDYYIFGHRHTNYTQYQRQGVAERIHMNSDGTFTQAEMTSCGLNPTPLSSKGTYPSYIACVLMSNDGACKEDVTIDKEAHPAITQDEQRESFITNLQDGCVIGYKYFDIQNVHTLSLCVKASDDCRILVKNAIDGESCGSIAISACKKWKNFEGTIVMENGVHPLYFVICGNVRVQLKSFTLD